ncbi:MAG: hypothetical protein RIR00_825, partial [Pseudomonadota bacterium]
MEMRPPVPMTEISRRLDVVFHPTAVGAAGRAVLACPWVPGRTVREHVAAAGVDPHLEIVIRVDGVLLTAAEWDSVIPDPGQLINVDAAAGQFGGDGGSNPIQAVLSIALMIAAPAIGGALAGAFGVSGTAFTLFGQAITWSGMLGAAAMLGGNMLIGAIFKPAAPALTNASASAAQASPTYSLSGGSNSLRLYEPLPLVLGSTRVFPDYLSKPFTEYHGEDQYLYQIFCFGVGDYVLSDFRIGETPITDYSDVTITRAVN